MSHSLWEIGSIFSVALDRTPGVRVGRAMSKLISSTECEKLLDQFVAKTGKQSELWLAYEKSKSYEMAYLALWAVIEDFAVHLGPHCQRLQLRSELGAWLAHLDDCSANAPAKISAGKFDLPNGRTAKIPPDSQLQLALPTEMAPHFYSALAVKKMYRNKRNAIAHSGETVAAKTYEDFKAVAVAAIAEIEAWLRLDDGRF